MPWTAWPHGHPLPGLAWVMQMESGLGMGGESLTRPRNGGTNKLSQEARRPTAPHPDRGKQLTHKTALPVSLRTREASACLGPAKRKSTCVTQTCLVNPPPSSLPAFRRGGAWRRPLFRHRASLIHRILNWAPRDCLSPSAPGLDARRERAMGSLALSLI